MADWAAGSARRRESCLQMGCYSLVLSALRQAIVRRLRQAAVKACCESLVREHSAIAWWRERACCAAVVKEILRARASSARL